MYDKNMQFNSSMSFWHYTSPQDFSQLVTDRVVIGVQIKTARFQDRDIIDMYTSIEGDEDLDWEDEDDYDALGDNDVDVGIQWNNWGDANNAGLGW